MIFLYTRILFVFPAYTEKFLGYFHSITPYLYLAIMILGISTKTIIDNLL